MTLETAQMLCTNARVLGFEADWLYKEVHKNHPCTVWARETYENWEWLCLHGLALHKEFRRRYHPSDHKSGYVIKKIYDNKLGPKEGKRTPFVQAMPDEYKQGCSILAYRTFYLKDKSRFATWSSRNPPPWWEGQQNENNKKTSA